MTLENRKSISNYRIISKLGEGGMGEVFLAEDPTLERKLAIKMLTDECCEDNERLGRFIREAKTASSLNHPNIITIFEFGKHEDSHFIASEFIDGRELNDVLSDEELSLEEALDIAVQVASALTAAHSAGIIHRDIKPSNIMIRRDGIVKVLDFGLAKLTVMGSSDRENVRIGEDDKTLIVPLHGVSASSGPEVSGSDITHPGIVMGTPKYMSPEQARGKDIDHQSDVFSLGVVLYEMLAGAPPFEGETISDVIAAVLTKDPGSLLEINSETPPELESILKKSLQKDKRERYRSADELLNDLNHVKNELQVRNVLERAEKSGSTIRISESLKIQTQKRTESRVSIAVLPFVNMSSNEGRDYFSEGLTEEINMNLSKLKMLRVVPRGTTMHYINENKTHKQMAEDLGVRYLLEGSVRRHGEELRITAQLVDAVNQEYLWSDAFGGTIKDVFEIQEKVATEIALALKVTLSPDEKEDLKKRFTENTEAYQLYLQGRFFWNKRNEEGLKTAIKYFEKAIEIDQDYALAWAGIADSYSLLAEFGTIPHKRLYPLAEAAVKKALELDDRLAEVHASYASQLLFSKWDWSNARKEFERALELNPNYATAHHWYSYWFLGMGDLKEAVRLISRASKLDPVSQAITKDKGMILYYDQQFDEAIVVAKKTLELDPEYPAAHRLLSLSYQGMGLYKEAIAENRLWGDLTGNHLEADFCLAQIYAVSGKRDNAKAIVENIEKQASAIDNVYRGLALVYTGLGEFDSALDMLEESFEGREVALLSMKVDPKLEPLRDNPRFTAILEKLGVS